MTRRLRLQLVAFFILAAVGTTYVAATYVGLGRLIGISGYEVSVAMPRTGGLFKNAEVTYRGFPIGRVQQLDAAPSGVTATVIITEDDLRIPRDVDVFVRNRSAIGEQYLDLRPRSSDGPWLAAGDRIVATQDQLPLPLDTFLVDVVAFVDSVPTKELGVVVDELYNASVDSGDDLRSLLDASSDLVRQAQPRLAATTSLIDDSDDVLATQVDMSDSITSFSTDLRGLAETLESSDGSLRKLLVAAPSTARAMSALLKEIGVPAARMIGNLLAVNGALGEHATELAVVLDKLPALVQVTDRILGPNGLELGLSTNFTDPRPCTSGYTQPRRGPEETGDARLSQSYGCAGGDQR